MRRRDLFGLLGGLVATWPIAGHGQQPERVRRIDRRLALDAADAPERVFDRSRGDGHHNDVGIRPVAAVLPDRGDHVTGSLPSAGEPAPDVPPPDQPEQPSEPADGDGVPRRHLFEEDTGPRVANAILGFLGAFIVVSWIVVAVEIGRAHV